MYNNKSLSQTFCWSNLISVINSTWVVEAFTTQTGFTADIELGQQCICESLVVILRNVQHSSLKILNKIETTTKDITPATPSYCKL